MDNRPIIDYLCPTTAATPSLARDQVPRAVAVPRPSRATCPVGGGSAAVNHNNN